MSRTCSIAIVAALFVPAAAAWAGELSESQRVRVETARDGSRTVDEAAFYALLENVREHPPTKVGAVIPDFDAIREDPAKHRAQLCYIEGRLIVAYNDYEPLDLGREGFEGVRGLTLQVRHFDRDWADLTADDLAVVFLTNPPGLGRPAIQMTHDLAAESGRMVRVPARFYKVLADETRSTGATRNYLTFVGHTATIEGASAGGSIDPGVRRTILFAAAVAAMLAYWFWRIVRARRNRAARASRVEEYLANKRQRQATRYERDGDTADEPAAPLPADPVEAMSVLKHDRPDAEDALQRMAVDSVDPSGDDAATSDRDEPTPNEPERRD